METLVYAANLMYVAAYFMSDILRLRVLTVTAASCLAVYFYCQPVPMLTVVGWNLFFVVLNMLQIARLVQAQRRDRCANSLDNESANLLALPKRTSSRTAAPPKQ